MTRAYPKHSVSTRRATSALSLLLAGATPERLREFTAAGLSASYNVSIPTAEAMLARAKQGRIV